MRSISSSRWSRQPRLCLFIINKDLKVVVQFEIHSGIMVMRSAVELVNGKQKLSEARKKPATTRPKAALSRKRENVNQAAARFGREATEKNKSL